MKWDRRATRPATAKQYSSSRHPGTANRNVSAESHPPSRSFSLDRLVRFRSFHSVAMPRSEPGEQRGSSTFCYRENENLTIFFKGDFHDFRKISKNYFSHPKTIQSYEFFPVIYNGHLTFCHIFEKCMILKIKKIVHFSKIARSH